VQAEGVGRKGMGVAVTEQRDETEKVEGERWEEEGFPKT